MKTIIANLFHRAPLGFKYGKIGFYEKSEEEIIKYINDKDMMNFQDCMVALSYKKTQSSFELIRAQFTNKDYYRRKCALEHIIFHDKFNKNTHVMKEVVLDKNELVVKSALEKIDKMRIKGIEEEVLFALEYWIDNEEIQRLCHTILKRYRVGHSDILEKNKSKSEEIKENNIIFKGNSQSIIQERMSNERYNREYTEILSKYKSYVGLYTLERIAEEFSKEGCGYAALATTLTQYFCHKEGEFRDKFGFELKDEEGYATDKIMLDFYCMLDEVGYGMNIEQLMERYEKYCESYDINVTINVVSSMDKSAFEEYTTNGYVIVFAGDFTMHFMKYKPVHIDGWHIMNAYNMPDEDTLEISTWGQKYALKLSELSYDTKYVQVIYR